MFTICSFCLSSSCPKREIDNIDFSLYVHLFVMDFRLLFDDFFHTNFTSDRAMMSSFSVFSFPKSASMGPFESVTGGLVCAPRASSFVRVENVFPLFAKLP